MPFVPRGAGTGLSGGALADDVVLVGLNRLTRILSIDPVERLAVVEPGVVNVALTRAADAVRPALRTGSIEPGGLHDRRKRRRERRRTALSQVWRDTEPRPRRHGRFCPTVRSSDSVTPKARPTATICSARSSVPKGCFGIALDVTVRLSPNPQTIRTLLADFTSVDAAARATSEIIASGIVPAALEMMDGATIRAVEASIYAAGYPVDAEAILLIELDGLTAGLEADVARVEAMCTEAGARTVRIARDDAERARLWQGRKKAFGAMGRVSSHLVVQDAVIPRTRLPDVLATIREIAERQRITVCNVFHAGDGNLHPNIGYNANDPDEQARVHAAMREIMAACVDAGGTITGEHGIGLDKLDYMSLIFSADSLAAMCRLREVFDPDRRANPGKVVPVHSCREWHGAPKAAWTA